MCTTFGPRVVRRSGGVAQKARIGCSARDSFCQCLDSISGFRVGRFWAGLKAHIDVGVERAVVREGDCLVPSVQQILCLGYGLWFRIYGLWFMV
jgi:hypothetical protein